MPADHGQRAHAACWRQHGHAGPAGMLWVIWVIWVTVLNCMAMHAGWLALGHLGHCFLVDPNDPKHGHAWHAGAKALGHLGHLVIVLKLVAGAALAWPYSLLGINPYIKIFYFLN